MVQEYMVSIRWRKVGWWKPVGIECNLGYEMQCRLVDGTFYNENEPTRQVQWNGWKAEGGLLGAEERKWLNGCLMVNERPNPGIGKVNYLNEVTKRSIWDRIPNLYSEKRLFLESTKSFRHNSNDSAFDCQTKWTNCTRIYETLFLFCSCLPPVQKLTVFYIAIRLPKTFIIMLWRHWTWTILIYAWARALARHSTYQYGIWTALHIYLHLTTVIHVLFSHIIIN